MLATCNLMKAILGRIWDRTNKMDDIPDSPISQTAATDIAETVVMQRGSGYHTSAGDGGHVEVR